MKSFAFLFSSLVVGALGCNQPSESGVQSARPVSKVDLFGKTFYVDNQSSFANNMNLRNGCPLWDATWVSASRTSCTFARYQPPRSGDDANWLAYKSDDGQFQVKGMITSKDDVGAAKIKIDNTEYFCKTSAAALLDSSGNVLVSDPKFFVLTTEDVGVFEKLDSAKVFGIATANIAACTAIFEKK